VTDTAAIESLRARREGRADPGIVTLRDFDQGIVESIGAKVTDSNYYVDIPGVSPPSGMPGVPVVFSPPEDRFEQYKIPCIWLSRDDISPTMERFQPGALPYRAPSRTALPVSHNGRTGFDRMVQAQQAIPVEISYTFNLIASLRGTPGATGNLANAMFAFALRVFTPVSAMYLTDSVGDVRSYTMFVDSYSMLDEVQDIANRMMGFMITARVEGELDVFNPFEQRTVLQDPTLNMQVK